jgi:hypothetical protein
MAEDFFGAIPDINLKKRMAAQLLQQASDVSPVRSWTQALARVVQGGMGGYLANQDAQDQTDATSQMAALLSGGTTPSATPAPASSSGGTSIPRGIRNNNPLNIEAGNFTQGQPGFAGSDGRFAKFSSMDQGTAAADALLQSYAKRGLNTVNGIVNRWAPPSDNNPTPIYAATVAKDLGVGPGDRINMADPNIRRQLVMAMGKFENGRAIPVMAAGGDTQPISAAAPTAAPSAASPMTAKITEMLSSPNPYLRAKAAQMASTIVQQKLGPQFRTTVGPDGTPIQVNSANGEIKAVPHEERPGSVKEYEYYQSHLPAGQTAMDYATWSNEKARAGATNVNNNFNPNSGATYDQQLAEGLGKSHASLANGVEEAQNRARDVAAMQASVDAIQKRGGTTGGLGQQEQLDLLKTINAGATALGLGSPFSEADISDKEFLSKYQRKMAGEMAKSSMGSRVTNFEMSNYLKSNPGLDTSGSFNQRALGIQAQIEQRNIAVGNAIRAATADAVSKSQKINPVTVQKIITDYDQAHHVQDPVTGQDLTQSYALPEFQKGGTNPDLAKQHEQNVQKIRRYNRDKGVFE